jgi:xyloglucan-specific exo-beta-1,4-glucanase
LGAGATSTAFPVIFGFFIVDGVTALFKTEDEGLNWQLISDAADGFGASSANLPLEHRLLQCKNIYFLVES